MSLASNVNNLATRVATEFNSVRTALSGKASTSHTHADPDAWLGGPVTLIEPVTSFQVMTGANQTCFARVIRGSGTITGIATSIGTSSGNVSVAVYSNAGTGLSATPGSQLATSGSVTCPAAGLQIIPLGTSITVSPGMWLAIGADNTTATFAALAIGTAIPLQLNMYQRQAAFPAPSTVSGTQSASRRFQLVGV